MTWDARTGHPLELFDRTVDPHQFENRVDDPRYKDPMRAGWATMLRIVVLPQHEKPPSVRT